MGPRPRGTGGFSLVEVLTVSVLLTMLLAVIYPLAQGGWRHLAHTGVETELRDAANLVMKAVEKDLLRAAVRDGQDGVVVSENQLKIVTAWQEGKGSSAQVPQQVVVYTIEQDVAAQRTCVYRYAGPPADMSRGMRMAAEDVDFSGSAFERHSPRCVLVKLRVEKGRQTLQTVALYRYGYGALPQTGE